jgi:hypothetical protein
LSTLECEMNVRGTAMVPLRNTRRRRGRCHRAALSWGRRSGTPRATCCPIATNVCC